MEITFTKRRIGNVDVVDVCGRLIFGPETDALRAEVKRIIEESGEVSIVLNLNDVVYVDSGGIGTLVGLFTSARNAGGDIKLASPTERVQHVLEITRLLPILGVYESESEALEAFKHKKAYNA